MLLVLQIDVTLRITVELIGLFALVTHTGSRVPWAQSDL